MPLKPCEGCGNSVSDQASICPHCGHPQRGAVVHSAGSVVPPLYAVPTQSTVVLREKHPVLAIIGGVAVVFVVVLVGISVLVSGGDKAPSQPPTPPPVPAFVVTNVTSDDRCTELGDYCVRAHCTVSNPGSAASEQPVDAELLAQSDQRVVAQRSAAVTLLASAANTVSFNFAEAVLDSSYTVRCTARGPQP